MPKEKKHKEGSIVQFEPQDVIVTNVDPAIIVDFEQVGCLRFCENIKGYNLQVTKEFAKVFDGLQAKVGALTSLFSARSIADPTKIILHGEEWFKGMELDLVHFKYILKPQQQQAYGFVVPRRYLQEHHSKLLEVIQRYFTCEGRFSKFYQYHIRLLIHFARKEPLKIPYDLFRSLSKMVDGVQDKGSQIKPSLFHFSLIKMLVIKVLNKKEMSRKYLLIS